jgi:cellobiose transport system substrate-binding protein
MSVNQRRLRKVAAVALVATTALGAVAACSKKDDSSDTAGGPITLTVDTFGKFGYEQLYKDYEASHPNIKIEPRVIDNLGDYTPKLTQYLAAGSGAGDVVALEEGIIGQFKANSDQFVDLKQYVGDLSAEYIPYKWQNGLSSDGSTLIGLPTDEGGMAMCYRSDLIKDAGLGDNRDAVSANWPTWDAFLAAAKKYKAATGKPMLDSTTTAFSAVMMQLGGDLFYDKKNNYVAGTSPTVKSAWDTAVKLIEGGASANLVTWSDDWAAGFKNGAFAINASWQALSSSIEKSLLG